jgi:hypothetical protein
MVPATGLAQDMVTQSMIEDSQINDKRGGNWAATALHAVVAYVNINASFTPRPDRAPGKANMPGKALL